MNQRKWLAWWEIPKLVFIFNYYPYKKVYKFGKLVEIGFKNGVSTGTFIDKVSCND